MVRNVKILSKSNLWRCVNLISVLLGTNPYSFERLVNEIDRIALEKKIKFYIQLGNTKKIPQYCQYDRFIQRDLLINKIIKSDMVITHGGFGSIFDAIRCNKTVIAVPRKRELGESQDFQEEIVKKLECDGRVIGVYDIKKLYKTLKKAYLKQNTFKTNNNICEIINNFILKIDNNIQ